MECSLILRSCPTSLFRLICHILSLFLFRRGPCIPALAFSFQPLRNFESAPEKVNDPSGDFQRSGDWNHRWDSSRLNSPVPMVKNESTDLGLRARWGSGLLRSAGTVIGDQSLYRRGADAYSCRMSVELIFTSNYLYGQDLPFCRMKKLSNVALSVGSIDMWQVFTV